MAVDGLVNSLSPSDDPGRFFVNGMWTLNEYREGIIDWKNVHFKNFKFQVYDAPLYVFATANHVLNLNNIRISNSSSDYYLLTVGYVGQVNISNLTAENMHENC